MAFPLPPDHLINVLRELFLQSDSSDISKRLVKPFRDFDAPQSTLNTTYDHIQVLERLREAEELPPIQADFLEDIQQRKNTDEISIQNFSLESESESESIVEDSLPDPPSRPSLSTRKSLYRTSFGKFFKGGVGGTKIREEEEGEEDSDSSDGGITDVLSYVSKASKSLLVDDQDDPVTEDEPMMNMDHEEDLLVSFDLLSNEDSLIDGSFTADDDEGIEDIAFERALQFQKPSEQSEQFTLDSKLGTLSLTENLLEKKTERKQRSDSGSQHLLVRKAGKSHQVMTSGSNIIVFTKKPIQTEERTSKLSLFLGQHKKNTGQGFEHALGDHLPGRERFEINVYVPSLEKYCDSPFKVKVRRSSSVFDVLGYILSKYDVKEVANINQWKLQLSDEGEVFDEGFGVLDRTEGIAKYQPDEVSLMKATTEEARAYEKLTPMNENKDAELVVSFKVSTETSVTNNEVTDANNEMANTLTLRQNTFMPSSNPTFTDEGLGFRVYLYPESGRYDVIHVPENSKVGDIVAKFCEAKHLNKEYYCIQYLNDTYLIDEQQSISRLKDDCDLQVLSKQVSKTLNRKIRPFEEKTVKYMPKKPQTPRFGQKLSLLPLRKSSFIPSSFSRRKKSNAPAFSQDESFVGLKVKRYIVWRRQQVKFISRHEKQLLIDGDYVYILPPETSSIDVKQSSFHASQIVRVKQLRKYPINFKIIIKRKKGPTEMKRYDFEAQLEMLLAEIVKELKELMGNGARAT